MHALQIATRPVIEGDRASLWQAYQEALRSHIEEIWGWDEDWQRAYFDKALLDASTHIVEVGGQFAGYVQLDLGAEVYLRMLILLPAFQSRGIGARLLGELLAASQARGSTMFLRVFRTNGQARQFYEREGWVVATDEGDFVLMRPAAEHACHAHG
jgi:ribosomal protein S18 acetylase RimI-like enzyme